jgi:hypothetical protein
MEYILLDFDGVLTSVANTRRCRMEHRRPNIYGLDWFDPACLEALKTIVDETGAGIVVSSSWRDLGDEALGRVWEQTPMPGLFTGTTPMWILTKKAAIEAWVKAHPDDRYVILDDADLRLPNQVRANPDTGLTMKMARKAIDILNADEKSLSLDDGL